MAVLIYWFSVGFVKSMSENDEKWISDNEVISTEDEVITTTENNTNLERFPDYPGWLWDSSKQEWVSDPDYSPENHPEP